MDVKKVGEAIRYLRVREGYTQHDIAEYLRISSQAVSKWERGICIPDAMYLSKLAEHLNVDLDDLLEGNITYLDDEWRGMLLLSEIQRFSQDEMLQMCDILLAYFMLAGIRRVTIQTDLKMKDDLKEKYQDGSRWGMHLEYLDNGEKFNFTFHMMQVAAPVFLYGTNLTKYFWRAMSRREGVSVLTVQARNQEVENRVTYDQHHMITAFHEGEDFALPIVFFPRGISNIYTQGYKALVENELLYAEPAARGLIAKEVRSAADLREVLQLKSQIERVTEERLYDLDEIAKARRLRQLQYIDM